MSDGQFVVCLWSAIGGGAVASSPTRPADPEAMLDAIEATVTDPRVTDAQIVEFDHQVADAATVLGISDEWLRGSPG